MSIWNELSELFGADQQAPASFGDVAAEEAALESGVGMVPLLDRTQIALRGPDRISFLHNLCTNDIRRLTPGQGCEAFLLNAQGKTLAHVYVFAEEEQLVLDTVPGQGEFLLRHLDRYLIREKVELVPLPNRLDLLFAGPKAAELLARHGVKNLPVEHCAHAPTNGGQFAIRRVDLAGPESWLHSLTSPMVVQIIWNASIELCATPCGATAFTAARIAAGVPLFGDDITDANLPQEIGRDRQAISFTKGCYLGQETVARIDALGHVNRLLVGLRGTGESAMPCGLELRAADGKPVGNITSTAFSHRQRRPIALGFVRRAQLAPGAKLTSDVGEVEVVATPMDSAAAL
jgi:folate-binding protein YgfZ